MKPRAKRFIKFEIFIIFIIVLLCLLGSSCRSDRVVERTIVKTDTCFIDKWQRDSIHVHDSVYITEKQLGDTVWLTRDRWHTQLRERIVHDSVYIAKCDTIRQTMVKEVEKKLNWWQRLRMTTGTFALAFLAAFIGIKLKRYL